MQIEIENMKVNIAAVIAALSLAFWLGGLTYMVSANAASIAAHIGQPAHPGARDSITTLDAVVDAKIESIDDLRLEVRRNSTLLQEVNTTLARLEERLANGT